MATLFHRSNARRAERAPLTAHGSINLVPLIDILTSIVFFSLLTYTGAEMAALTAYGLTLPPVLTTQAQGATTPQSHPSVLLSVRIEDTGLDIENTEGQGARKITGTDSTALDELQRAMLELRRTYRDVDDVVVVPTDNTSYAMVIRVLDRLRLAGYTGISLVNRARAGQGQAKLPGT